MEIWKNARSCQVARPDLFAALDFHRMIKWILTCVAAMGTLWIQVGSDLPAFEDLIKINGKISTVVLQRSAVFKYNIIIIIK